MFLVSVFWLYILFYFWIGLACALGPVFFRAFNSHLCLVNYLPHTCVSFVNYTPPGKYSYYSQLSLFFASLSSFLPVLSLSCFLFCFPVFWICFMFEQVHFCSASLRLQRVCFQVLFPHWMWQKLLSTTYWCVTVSYKQYICWAICVSGQNPHSCGMIFI